LRFWRLNLQIMAEYPLNLLIWFIFGTLYHLVSVGILWAMLELFPSIDGWTFPDLFFLYALWSLGHGVYAVTLGKLALITRQIREGDFDRYLIRPVGTLFQVTTTPEGITLDDLVVGIALFAAAQAVADIEWSLLQLALLPLVIGGAALIKGGLLLAVNSLSFWAVNMQAGRLLIETIEMEFIRFPLSIFPVLAQWILTFVIPFAFVSFLPAQLFLEKSTSGNILAPELGYLVPVVGILTFGVAYALWVLGLRRYSSTGS
jgi:ABC-2 type transport system permease protein